MYMRQGYMVVVLPIVVLAQQVPVIKVLLLHVCVGNRTMGTRNVGRAPISIVQQCLYNVWI